jgi:hypothetical protein
MTPRPSVIIFPAPKGEVWMNLGAEPEIEIEYRMFRGEPGTFLGVLTWQEVISLCDQMRRTREIANRIEHGEPVTFPRPERDRGDEDDLAVDDLTIEQSPYASAMRARGRRAP